MRGRPSLIEGEESATLSIRLPKTVKQKLIRLAAVARGKDKSKKDYKRVVVTLLIQSAKEDPNEEK